MRDECEPPTNDVQPLPDKRFVALLAANDIQHYLGCRTEVKNNQLSSVAPASS